jgi:ubiquinol-cytochrome c reductase cytochrome b subunit
VLLFPDALNHPDNYIPADPMETPKQLVPEWYFLPFYAILRSIPHKAGGISAMGGAILVLFLIPFNYTGYVRNTTYRPIFQFFYWFLVADFIALFYIGQAPIEDQYMVLGQYAAIYYFSFFVLIVPVVGIIENKLAFYEDPKDASKLDSNIKKETV